MELIVLIVLVSDQSAENEPNPTDQLCKSSLTTTAETHIQVAGTTFWGLSAQKMNQIIY